MNKRRLIPLFAAFVLWGSQYVISKIALRTVPPLERRSRPEFQTLFNQIWEELDVNA